MTLPGRTTEKRQSVSSKNGEKSPLRKPRSYQRRGVEWLLGHGGAGLFADPGCGKTIITLRALLALKDAGVSRRALVLAPLRVAYEVWPREAAEWAGTEWGRVSELRVVVLHGKDKERRLMGEGDIFVINYEGLAWLCENNYARVKALNVDTLVVDESSKLKHTRTKRFKTLKPLLPRFARRWILTGTPNPNGYMDLFGQIYVIDLGRALGPYVTHFRMQYFYPLDRNGWEWALKSDSEKRIQEAVAPYIFRLDANDYLQLPEEVSNIIRVDLPPDARRIYDAMEEDLLVELRSEKIVTAASSGAAAMKCAQVANGGLFHEAPTGNEDAADTRFRRSWENLHDAKTEAVVDLVEELGGTPCIVAYDFEHDLARLRRAFPNAPFVGGGVSPKKSAAIFEDWNRDKIPVLLVQPQTVSHGLNLQYGSAQHLIFHSLVYDYEVYDQLIRRLRRQGSRHDRIFVHHIVARDTVDEAKLRSLRRKEKTQKGFLAALKEYAKARGDL